MADLTLDDISTLIPPPSEAGYQALKDDVAQHGPRQLVLFCRGVCIDGRSLRRACEELGVPYRSYEFQPDTDLDDILDLVLSANIMRRDLSQSQRAIIAARLAPHYSEPARLRRLANLPQYTDGAILPHRDEAGRVTAILERKVGVSATYIKHAMRLVEQAPDLAADVEEGERTLMGAMRELEIRTGPRPRKSPRRGRKKKWPEEDVPPSPPVLPDLPGENTMLAFEYLAERWSAGGLSEPEELGERLLALREGALRRGEVPDERYYKALLAMKMYLLRAEQVYQEGASSMLEATVIEHPPLPEPAPEPVGDLIGEAMRLGAVVGLRAATTRGVPAPTPPTAPNPSGSQWHTAWGSQWRIGSEEEWDAAEPGSREKHKGVVSHDMRLPPGERRAGPAAGRRARA